MLLPSLEERYNKYSFFLSFFLIPWSLEQKISADMILGHKERHG
jgi:hypothetical protein